VVRLVPRFVPASANIQKRLVVVARRCYPTWGVVALFLAQLLECSELLLLVVAQMAKVRRRVLERLDPAEVRHADRVGCTGAAQ
jgi:hypothetical protein